MFQPSLDGEGISPLLEALETAKEFGSILGPDVAGQSQRGGEKSEAFCRQSLRMLAENPQIIPPNLDVAEAIRDLEARDRLRPRLMRLTRLLERGNDTDFGLGSDAMTVAVQGYGLLKLVGRSEGLDALRKELGTRFSKTRRTAPEEMKAA